MSLPLESGPTFLIVTSRRLYNQCGTSKTRSGKVNYKFYFERCQAPWENSGYAILGLPFFGGHRYTIWLTAQQWLVLSANHGQWCLEVAKAQLTLANHYCRVQVRTTHLSFVQIPDQGCSGSLSISSNLSKHMRLCCCHHLYTLKFWCPPIKCKCENMPPREFISRRAIKHPSLPYLHHPFHV